MDERLETDGGRLDEVEYSLKRVDAMEKYYKVIEDKVAALDKV